MVTGTSLELDGGGKFMTGTGDVNCDIYFSSNGKEWLWAWDFFATDIVININAITYGGGKFVAVGSNGTMAWSE